MTFQIIGRLLLLWQCLLFAKSRLLSDLSALSHPLTAMAAWDEGAWDDGHWDTPTAPVFQPLPQKKKPTNRRTMATNPTPDDDDVLISLTEDLADGCHLHEVALGIKQQTEAVMRAVLLAGKTALLGLGTAKVLRGQKEGLLDTADAAGTLVLKNCRQRMVKLYGPDFNANWEAAGWPNGSTAVPRTSDDWFTLLGAMDLYFQATPAAESDAFDATAAICQTAHEAVSNARGALNVAESGVTTAKNTLVTTMKTLRKRVRGLIVELGTLMAEDDPRWEDFGLNIPANPSAPEAIEDLTLTTLSGGKVLAQWPYATRMTGTRIMLKRVGEDDEPASAGTTGGLEKVVPGLTVGQTIEAFVIAYNDGGDAPPSPTKSVVVT